MKMKKLIAAALSFVMMLGINTAPAFAATSKSACRAFGLKVSEEEATAARLRSRRAYLLTWSVVGNDEETADSEDAITDADFM